MAYTITETPHEAWQRMTEYFGRKGARIAVSRIGGYTQCNYRVGMKPEGRACAVGCLIPNEKYKPEMDTGIIGGPISSLHRSGLVTVASNETRHFLVKAQQAHDHASMKGGVAGFRKWLKENEPS